MTQMTCPNCGAEISESTKFCSKCGFQIIRNPERENTSTSSTGNTNTYQTTSGNIVTNPNQLGNNEKKKVSSTLYS